MISAGCLPASLGAVWIGETCPPPELLAAALSDREDDPPAYRCRPMPDQDPRETTETLAPPTDPEPPTSPENEKPEPKHAMNPPPPAPPEYWKAAYDKLVEIHEDARRDRESRAARDDALVMRLSAAAKEASESSVTHLTTALSEIAVSVERIGTRLVSLEANDEAHAKRLAEGDERFGAIEQQLADLKALVTKLEADLAEAKAHVPARTAPSPG